MDQLLRSARDNFPNTQNRRRQPAITLGMSGYLIMVSITFHISLALIISSRELAGSPIRCHDAHPQQEEICASNLFYLKIGEHIDADPSYAYFRISHWIFLVIAVVGITFSYLWSVWEAGVVAQLCGDFVGAVKSEEDSDKQAHILARHLDKFDLYHPYYFILYVVAEVLKVLYSVAVFSYYNVLLSVDIVGYKGLFVNYFTSNIGQNSRVLQNDPVLQLFPREIACPYEFVAQTGEMASVVHRCKVANQDYVEFAHLILLLVSLVVLSLFVINSIYIILRFRFFDNLLAKEPRLSKTDKLGLAKLSTRKRLVLFLLHNNLDAWTHEMLMRKVIRIKPKSVP